MFHALVDGFHYRDFSENGLSQLDDCLPEKIIGDESNQENEKKSDDELHAKIRKICPWLERRGKKVECVTDQVDNSPYGQDGYPYGNDGDHSRNEIVPDGFRDFFDKHMIFPFFLIFLDLALIETGLNLF